MGITRGTRQKVCKFVYTLKARNCWLCVSSSFENTLGSAEGNVLFGESYGKAGETRYFLLEIKPCIKWMEV